MQVTKTVAADKLLGALNDLCRRASERKINLSGLRLMVLSGRSGYEIVRQLIREPEPSEGLTKLVEAGCPELTVEYLALDSKWQLTEAERQLARDKLNKYFPSRQW